MSRFKPSRVRVRAGNALSEKILRDYDRRRAQAPAQASPAAPAATRGAYWHLGLIMIAFGLPLWFWGASYSLDGWIIGLELLGTAIKVPIRVPAIPGDLRLLFILFLGVVYSLAEIKARPPTRAQLRGMRAGEIVAVVLGLVLAHGTDLGSTYLALATPGPAPAPLAAWVASLPPVNVGVTIVITYIPELLIATGFRMAADLILYPLRWAVSRLRSMFGG